MKKALSMLIAIVMVLSMLPMAAFAAETGGKITFTTDFEEGMGVGDTFSVTATLSENPGIASFANQLKWNDKVVKFTGFANDPDDEEYKYTEVMAKGWVVVTNDETGFFTAAIESNKTKNGDLYTANFEIIAGGELGLGLVATETGVNEFIFADELGNDINPVVDLTAITGLKAEGPTAGPEMPEDAPFTAITTDAGDIVAVEYVEDKEFNYGYVPYYVVTIPADATTAYVTAPDQVVMEDWTTGALQATGYAADLADMSTPLYVSYNYEDTADGPKVEIPMYMTVSDWSGSEMEMCFVADEWNDATHAFGIEDASYACLGLISFVYDDGSASEPVYTISSETVEGGSVAALNEAYEQITEAKEGDLIYLDVVAEDGYKAMSYGYIFEGQTYHCENGCFTMPAGDVTLTAAFQKQHTHAYGREVAADRYLKSEATCQSAAVYYKSCECGEFAETAETFTSGATVACVYVNGSCKWCGAAEPVVAPGYTFAASADVTAENGGTAAVSIKITGHSDETVDYYNAYDLTLAFDDTKLTYVGCAGAVVSDNGSVTVDGNAIRIVGCGEPKDFGTEVAVLTFETLAEGAANVTITKAQVSDKDESIEEDAPEASAEHAKDDTDADETPDVSVVIVPYTVTKPGFVSGNEVILHGEDYTFSYTDTANYTYSELNVTVGGAEVIPTLENGVYTVANVTGALVITAKRTPNSYKVTFNEDNTAKVEGPEEATYGEDYIFTVTPSEGMGVDGVKITKPNGEEISYTINEKGEYVIEGTDITGEFTVTVTEKETETTITFSGIEESEIVGGLTQSAEIGKEFTFELNKAEGYDYIVKVGTTELTEENGKYTVPADMVVAGGVTVIIGKVDNTRPVVEVAEYISLDGKVMFLVTAKWGGRVLAYGENTMFWSDKYTVDDEAGAYCWLVISTDEMNTVDQVKAAAEAAIVAAAEGATATAVKYDYDVNGTSKVDINDAQLAYDMYNASYMEFSENLPMLKFLEADMETDSKLDTKDVAAIISYIVNGANA